MRRRPISLAGKSGKWCPIITWKRNVKSDLRTKSKITCSNFVRFQIFGGRRPISKKMCSDGEKSWLKSVETLVRPLRLAAGSGAEAPPLAAHPKSGLHVRRRPEYNFSHLGWSLPRPAFYKHAPFIGPWCMQHAPLTGLLPTDLPFSLFPVPPLDTEFFSCFCFPFLTIFLSLIFFFG